MNTAIMTPAEKAKMARNQRIIALWKKYKAQFGEMTTANRIYKLIEQEMGICPSTIRAVVSAEGLITITPRS